MTVTKTVTDTFTTSSAGSAQVSWLFELSVKSDQEGELRTLMAEMVESTDREEPGTLDYEWHLSDDSLRLHVFERYANNDAAMAHITTFGERYMARFFGCLVPERMTIYGAPDERVRGALAGLSPTVMSRVAGFSR